LINLLVDDDQNDSWLCCFDLKELILNKIKNIELTSTEDMLIPLTFHNHPKTGQKSKHSEFRIGLKEEGNPNGRKS